MTMQIKKAKSGIFDQYRGVFLNRGVFIKAPPAFFQAYPSEFENPPFGWEKLNVRVKTIERWDPKTGVVEQPAPKIETKLEVAPPMPTVVSESPVIVEPAVLTPVAEQPALASGVAGDVVAPKRGRGRPRKAAL
jgi:hypothetical protein